MKSGASARSFWVPSSSSSTRALDAGLPEERHDLLRGHDAPGVVAVVEVGIDDGQIGGLADGRHGERHDKGDELEHGDITSRVRISRAAPA